MFMHYANDAAHVCCRLVPMTDKRCYFWCQWETFKSKLAKSCSFEPCTTHLSALLKSQQHSDSLERMTVLSMWPQKNRFQCYGCFFYWTFTSTVSQLKLLSK